MSDKEKIPQIEKTEEEKSPESSRAKENTAEVNKRVADVMEHTKDDREKTKVRMETENYENEDLNKIEYSLYNDQGLFEIPQEDKDKLVEKIDEVAVDGYKKIGWFKKRFASYLTGHKVACEKDYDCGTASYSTKTSIIEIGGNKYFVVYNYPGSNRHRKADTGCRKAWGEKALKASEEDWRETFVGRSLIPVHKGENDRIVVLPFIPNISLIDVLEKYEDGLFNGDYEYGRRYKDIAAKIDMIGEVSSAMRELHEEGKTWGEVIPANLGVTKEGKVLFFDPETPYVEDTSDVEQKARDLWSWCMSSCGALNRSDLEFDKYTEIINKVLNSYGDKEVVAYMQKNLCKNLSFWKTVRHPVAWGQFKARLTSSGRKQYNQVMDAMREFK